MMNMHMALMANRNYIEPMFWFIRPMVILFCLFATGTPIVKCWKQFAVSNSMIDSIFGLIVVKMKTIILFLIIPLVLFSMFCYNVFSHVRFLCKRIWSEPPESYILSRGLSYYNTLGGLVNA